MQIKKFKLTDYSYFLGIYLLFLLVFGTGLLYWGKIDFQIRLNNTNTSTLDYLFYYSTQLVETIPLITFFVLVGYFSNIKKMVVAIICYAATGMFTQFLKRNVFGKMPRPAALIDNLNLLPESFHVKQHMAHSFPSGHTTTAFALAVFFTWCFDNKKLGALFAVIAVLIGYSRVYLSQHFVIDVLAGATIGTMGSLVLIALLENKQWGKLSQYNLLGKKI